MQTLIEKAVTIKNIALAALDTAKSKELRQAYKTYSLATRKALKERNKAISKARKAYKKAMLNKTHAFNDKVIKIYKSKRADRDVRSCLGVLEPEMN